MRIGTQLGGGHWLAPLFLLIGVLAPTACVLWFMNVAVNNQRDASRLTLSEAYRGQLALLRDRVDAYWALRASDLERETREGPAPAVFERVVKLGLADSAVVLGPAPYPSVAGTIAADPAAGRADWMAVQTLESWRDGSVAAASWAAIAKAERDPALAARAAQARIRCLVRAGDKAAAIRAVEEEFFSASSGDRKQVGKKWLAGESACPTGGTDASVCQPGGRRLQATDLTGRVIAADELLLAIHLMSPEDPRRDPSVQRLAALVNDYAATPMPAAQRLYLMDELRGATEFPTYAAERAAAQFLEAGRAQAGEAALEASGVADLWKLTVGGGRVLALYRTATVLGAMRSLGSERKVALAVTPPGRAAPAGGESLPAGSRLPGWQISLLPAADRAVDELARRQTTSYVWIGMLAIAVVAITALAAGGAVRRQWQAARLKTDLAAAVSHELRTPLASMRLLVDTLLDDEAPDSTKTREYLELIARENARLSRLIENFLTFSRLERNRQKFDFRATPPERVVRSAVEAVQDRFPVEVDLAPGLPAVHADEDALTTVLLNLLDNACKYTPGEKHIVLKAFPRNGHVVFAVQDNGIGIAPRERRKIFRRFYQVDQRLARESGGCGLGLSIVEFIVRAHGGTVQVESQPGRGSTFSVELP